MPTRSAALALCNGVGAAGLPELARRPSYFAKGSLGPAQDPTDHLWRNVELLSNLKSRMAALTTQPEIQPHDLLLHRAEGLQEVGQAMAIHGHLAQDTLVPLSLSVRTGSAPTV